MNVLAFRRQARAWFARESKVTYFAWMADSNHKSVRCKVGDRWVRLRPHDGHYYAYFDDLAIILGIRGSMPMEMVGIAMISVSDVAVAKEASAVVLALRAKPSLGVDPRAAAELADCLDACLKSNGAI